MSFQYLVLLYSLVSMTLHQVTQMYKFVCEQMQNLTFPRVLTKNIFWYFLLFQIINPIFLTHHRSILLVKIMYISNVLRIKNKPFHLTQHTPSCSFFVMLLFFPVGFFTQTPLIGWALHYFAHYLAIISNL